MSTIIDAPPPKLPVSHLSLSSLRLFMTCPESWMRKHILHEPEQPSGKMILGGAAGATLAQHFGLQIETGQGMSAEQLLDEFDAEWNDRRGREEVDWRKDEPGQLKDSAAAALKVYHQHIAPTLEPVAVEREFELHWPGCDWTVVGYIDLETIDGRVHDYKMTGKRMSQPSADADLQPTIYCAARRAEGNPAAGFDFDTMIRTRQPTAEIVSTSRTDLQLDLLTDRIFNLAREIEWRCETSTWAGCAPTPNNWICNSCSAVGCPWRLG